MESIFLTKTAGTNNQWQSTFAAYKVFELLPTEYVSKTIVLLTRFYDWDDVPDGSLGNWLCQLSRTLPVCSAVELLLKRDLGWRNRLYGYMPVSFARPPHHTLVRTLPPKIQVDSQVAVGDATARVERITASTDGDVIIGAGYSQTYRPHLWVWRRSGGDVDKYEAPGDIYSVSMSNDGTLLAVGCRDKMVHLFSVERWHCIKVLDGHTELVRSVKMSGDGMVIASGSHDRTVRIWDRESGTCKEVKQDGKVDEVAISRDGNLFACTAQGPQRAVFVWARTGGNDWEIQRTLIHDKAPSALAMNHTGSVIVSGDAGACVRVWSGEDAQTRTGHTNPIMELSMCGDSDLFVSCAVDGVRVWSTQQVECISILCTDIRVPAVAISHSPTRIFTGSIDRPVRGLRVWKLPEEATNVDQLSSQTTKWGSVSCIVFVPHSGRILSG